MMFDIPANFEEMDSRLVDVLKAFAPPEDLGKRVIANLQNRSRMIISPRVAQSAAAVAAVLVIGTFGYFADQKLNPPALNRGYAAVESHVFFDKSGKAVSSGKQSTSTGEMRAGFGFNGRAGEDQVDLAMKQRLSTKFEDELVDGPVAVKRFAEKPAAKPKAQASTDYYAGVKIADFDGDNNKGVSSLNSTGTQLGIDLPKQNEWFKAGSFYRTLVGPDQSDSRRDTNGAARFGVQNTLDNFAKDREEVSDEKRVAGQRENGEVNKPVTVQLNDQQIAQAITKTEKEKAEAPGLATTTPPQQQNQAVQVERNQRIIRTGTMEFEVDSFDSSIMTITKLATEDGGIVANTDSAKLTNGKTRGQITVRIPPDRLDTFVLKLRGVGDLKTQKISSQDVSKAYTDIESGLRAARAMEKRLLEMIEKGNGAIKDLLAAEKELGVWREKIEQMEGEKRFYDNQIALSTLTITLQERDIKAAAGAIEFERISTGVESEDVEKSRDEIRKTIDSVGGRILSSDLKKLDAGQFAANITAEVAADKSGQVIDRLKQLGKIARMDVDRKQTTVDGQSAPTQGAHIEQKPTIISISIYNLANVAPRLTTSMTLACGDVEESYKQILAAIEKAGGRAVTSQLQRPRSDQIVANINIECPSAKAAELQTAIKALGETMNLQLSENPDTNNVTTTKTGFVIQAISASSVAPRETSSMQLAATDVTTAHKVLNEAAAKLNARVLQSSLTDNDQDNLVSSISIEIPRSALDDFEKSLGTTGDILKRSITRSSDTQNTIDSKLRYDMTIYSANRLPPRETSAAVVNVSSADQSQAVYASMAQELGGRVIDQGVNRDQNGRNISRITIDVPREKSTAVLTALRTAGDLWKLDTSTNAQAPDGPLARARFELTFSEGQALVDRQSGFWQSLKDGISTSLRGLGWSVQILIVGLFLVAPWVLILWFAWKLLRRRKVAKV